MFGSSRKKQTQPQPELHDQTTIIPEPTPEALRVSEELARAEAVRPSEPPSSARADAVHESTERPRHSFVRVRNDGAPRRSQSAYCPPSPRDLAPQPKRSVTLVPRPSRPLDLVQRKSLAPASASTSTVPPAPHHATPPALPLTLQTRAPRRIPGKPPTKVKKSKAKTPRADETLRMWTLPPTPAASSPRANSIDALEAAAATMDSDAFRIDRT